MRVCRKCYVEQPMEQFSFYKPHLQRHTCKTCNYEQQQQWVAENREHVNDYHREDKRTKRLDPEFRLKEKEASLKSNYGLSMEDAHSLLASQGGNCALCMEIPNNPVVDHNHATGEVRGVLCHSCNIVVGKFETQGLRIHVISETLVKQYLGLSPKES